VVRVVDADPDRAGAALPGRPVRLRLLAAAARLDPRASARRRDGLARRSRAARDHRRSGAGGRVAGRRLQAPLSLGAGSRRAVSQPALTAIGGPRLLNPFPPPPPPPSTPPL